MILPDRLDLCGLRPCQRTDGDAEDVYLSLWCRYLELSSTVCGRVVDDPILALCIFQSSNNPSLSLSLCAVSDRELASTLLLLMS